MADKNDIKEQLTAVDSAGLERERQKAKKQAARAEAQGFRHRRALHMMAEQGAVDLFARCVAVFAGMGRLWAVPRSNDAEPQIVAEAQAMAEEAKALATHEGRDGFSVANRGDGECYLLVNVMDSGSHAATVEVEAGFWYRNSHGFLDERRVGTLTYKFPSWEMQPG